MEQVFSPEPHEAWMRLTIVGMFIGFGVYSQWIIGARRRAEKEALRTNAELIQIKNILERKEAEKALMLGHERLRDLTTHLQVVREEERTFVAREIHDELGQALTALKMDVHWLRQRLPDEKPLLIDKADAMSRVIDWTVQSVRKICAQLRPGLLDDFGLAAAMEWETQEFSKRTDIETEIVSNTEDLMLPQDISTAIFRVFQEALTNITRHAKATRVEIILKKNQSGVEMRVSDNGKGIKEREIVSPKSFGLMGMRERVHYLGGDLRINGNRKGTTVEVFIPVHQEGGVDDQDTGGR